MIDSITKPLTDLFEKMARMQARTQAGHALLGAAIVDNALLLALQAKMVNLSNRAKADLFEGYGPLASFSARIDVSHALGIISTETHKHLRAVKKIRNAFAHTTDFLDFKSPEILKYCALLPGFRPGMNAENFYLKALRKIDDEIRASITPEGGQPSSPEKSPPPPLPHSPSNDEKT